MNSCRYPEVAKNSALFQKRSLCPCSLLSRLSILRRAHSAPAIDVEVVEGHARVSVDGLLLGLKHVMANIRLQRESLDIFARGDLARDGRRALSSFIGDALEAMNCETTPIRFPILTWAFRGGGLSASMPDAR